MPSDASTARPRTRCTTITTNNAATAGVYIMSGESTPMSGFWSPFPLIHSGEITNHASAQAST
ncbi:hypothetical protein [Propionibacterium freudenreichii]|uniref:hypothetical protein n=1 Tax=Propionibacterium freudenreichii TaxID=1744 RepID=UPI0021A4577C|nr:hypothetical protein [Propionibacterium freudenreichii]